MTIRSLISAAHSARSLDAARKLSHPKLFAPAKTQLIALAEAIEATGSPMTVVTSTGRQAEMLSEQLRQIIPDLNVIEFPSWETLPHERLSPAPQTVGRRIAALQQMQRLAKDSPKTLILMSIRAALQPVVAGLE